MSTAQFPMKLMLLNRTRSLLRAQIALLAILAVPALFANNSTQVVVVPVANMYSAPNAESDVVSQAIYGSNVTLLVARGEWSRVQTSDHYKGWISSHYLRLVQSGNGYATSGPAVQVESLFANVYRAPDVTRHKPVLTIPFETRLEVIDEGSNQEENKTPNNKDLKTKDPKMQDPRSKNPKHMDASQHAGNNSHEGWLQVRLPDKRSAWIQSGDVIADPKPLSIPESIELAKRFLGLPYLWGGRSSFGYDCSGFTQMLVLARGINMPRDADQQAAWTGVIPVDRKDLQSGDLLFFGSSLKDITHTGMYIGDGEFIHDTTNGHPVVQISRLDDLPWTRLLVASRRVK
jgi:cell wall-associated NlpC family hydrolase